MSRSDERSAWIVADDVRRRMAATRGRDTKPELSIRRLLHARGWRYRVHYKPLVKNRRTVDIAFTRHKLAVMVDGCFWHGCPVHYRPATSTRAEFWRDKIDGNRARDSETDRLLREAGWRVFRFWEHEDPDAVVAAIERELARAVFADPVD